MAQKRVLVLYAGGTIGMKPNSEGVLSPVKDAFLNKLKENPEMNDVIWTQKHYNEPLRDNQLILKQTYHCEKILYEIIEYPQLLDSSNTTCKEWIMLANDIKDHYNDYDGFVILHGTDTLSYTSSALSFMLENLQKPVILTGAQISIFESRSDAINNMLSSVLIAGSLRIPEVCVFFGNKLYRGNRTTKTSNKVLDAFDSPNYHSLIDVGIGYTVHDHYIRTIDTTKTFKVSTDLNPNVAVFFFFPTVTGEMLASFLQPSIKGLIIQTFGTGNIPSDKKDLLEVLRNAINRETLIVNITQCLRGKVSDVYETGKVLDEVGVVPGGDMTTETALTKLSYILGLQGLTFSQKAEVTDALKPLYIHEFLRKYALVKKFKNLFKDPLIKESLLYAFKQFREFMKPDF